jgi:ABC-type glycerol-3-phosphate transport system substrate-binding protein
MGVSPQGVKLGGNGCVTLVHHRRRRALSIFNWDHWVPAGNEVMKKQITAWADKNKVDVQADFITSMGNKTLLTINAEAQARPATTSSISATGKCRPGHLLEPVDDLARLEASAAPQPGVRYLNKTKGKWAAVPSSWGTQNKGPCGHLDLRDAAGIDVVKMYPAADVPRDGRGESWTYDAFLKAAEACHKVGRLSGGLGTTGDSVDTAGAIFSAFGADLVTAGGDLNMKADAVRQVLEFGQRFVKFLPADAVSYDDASNNRALISGQSALIWNPPSAWAVAIRDAPDVAKDCWTFPAPSGPKGPSRGSSRPCARRVGNRSSGSLRRRTRTASTPSARRSGSARPP